MKGTEPYTRRPEVESALQELSAIPIEEVAELAKIFESSHEDFIPTECLIYFVRRSKENGDSTPYRDIFNALRTRVLRAIPVRRYRLDGGSKIGENDADALIQEGVMFAFQKLLCEDRKEYDERLDYFEVMFNDALSKLRATERRRVFKKESRKKPMDYEDDGASISTEMEQKLAYLKSLKSEKFDDPAFRIRFLDAIKNLPPIFRAPIELYLDGIQIDSEIPGKDCMSKILNCKGSTVQKRLKRAHRLLSVALNDNEEEEGK